MPRIDRRLTDALSTVKRTAEKLERAASGAVDGLRNKAETLHDFMMKRLVVLVVGAAAGLLLSFSCGSRGVTLRRQ